MFAYERKCVLKKCIFNDKGTLSKCTLTKECYYQCFGKKYFRSTEEIAQIIGAVIE